MGRTVYDDYGENIAAIVLHIARTHQASDWGDCSINHPIVSVVDRGGSAAEFLRQLLKIDSHTAAGIVKQIGWR
jgi:hypothetical protein